MTAQRIGTTDTHFRSHDTAAADVGDAKRFHLFLRQFHRVSTAFFSGLDREPVRDKVQQAIVEVGCARV